MELRQLRYFSVLAQELHFGRAAERLHISQPPLSVQIRKLEAELKVSLVDRTTRTVRLTPAGEELQHRLEHLLPLLDDAVRGLDEVQQGLRGRISMGFMSSASYTILPAAVQQFRSLRPNVEVRFQPLTTAEQIDRVIEGTLDLGVVRDPVPSPHLETRTVVRERLVACVPAGHPLAERTVVTPAEVMQNPLIGYPRHFMPGFVDVVRTALAPARAQVRYAHTFVHQETSLGFVAAGEGVSILPESLRCQLPPSVRAADLDTDVRTEMALVAAADRPLPPAALVLVDCLKQAAAAQEAENAALSTYEI
ncbi:LysR family transcriptional regulator [Micrococcus luteus]|uniref:LysR family transcriptional regulator n=1 Tax=Micrococcus luteus TaxID=1270 RepID=UPI0037B81AA5